MGNQLAIVEHGQVAETAPQFSFTDMERMALAFAKSGLFGVQTPDQALALCLVAHAEGRHPALAARDYDIIQGRPAKKAEAMQRDFLTAGGKIEWHQLDDACADATFSHPLGGSARITWDLARAKAADLGGKPMWKKFPRQMLRSRVVSEGVRTVFPMATSGMYVPEEVRDFDSDKPATPKALRARDIQADPDANARAKAEQWVADQITAANDATDLDALDAVIQAGNKAVTKLAREHADLHAKVQEAYEARGHALQGYEPEVEETSQSDAIAALRETIEGANGKASWDEASAAFHAIEGTLDDETRDELAAALDARKQYLMRKAG